MSRALQHLEVVCNSATMQPNLSQILIFLSSFFSFLFLVQNLPPSSSESDMKVSYIVSGATTLYLSCVGAPAVGSDTFFKVSMTVT